MYITFTVSLCHILVKYVHLIELLGTLRTVLEHGTHSGITVDIGILTLDIALLCGFECKILIDLHQLGIQLYACSAARRADGSDKWLLRLTNGVAKQEDPYDGGKGSFAQLLSEAMGPDATVFGHTTDGHLSKNYEARCFGKLADNSVYGRHMFDVYFPQSYVEEQAKRLNTEEDKVRTEMFKFYSQVNPVYHFAGDDDGRSTLIDPEGKGKRMRDGWFNGDE